MEVKYFLQSRDRLVQSDSWKDHEENVKEGYPNISELLRDMFNADIKTMQREFRIVKVYFVPRTDEVK